MTFEYLKMRFLLSVIILCSLASCYERPPPGIHGMLKLSGAAKGYAIKHSKLPLSDKYSEDRCLSDQEYDVLVKLLRDQGLIEKKGETHLDDWGNRYRVTFDYDGDGHLRSELVNGHDDLYIGDKGYVIWSKGRNGKEEVPFIDSSTGLNSDNVMDFPIGYSNAQKAKLKNKKLEQDGPAPDGTGQ